MKLYEYSTVQQSSSGEVLCMFRESALVNVCGSGAAHLKLSWRMSGTSRPYFLAPNARNWPLGQSSEKVRCAGHSCGLHIGHAFSSPYLNRDD